MLVYAPRFSKYMHGCAALNPDAVDSMPYWYLRNDDGTLSTATWEEMADRTENRDRVRDREHDLMPVRDHKSIAIATKALQLQFLPWQPCTPVRCAVR